MGTLSRRLKRSLKKMRNRAGFILLISMFTQSIQLYGQGCPACSNPALQSSEKLEAGADTLHKGTFRATFNGTGGLNYQGGHKNYSGLTKEGALMEVPEHEHLVNLNFLRSEFALEYTFMTNWSSWLRIPYDVKIQTATVEFTEVSTPIEQEAIIRNRDNHHRDESYVGLSDLRLFIARRFNGLLGKHGRLDLALGSSLPTGSIEDDPIQAGNNGEKHLHIQFGTGTFDPLLEIHYTNRLSKKLSLALFTMNKIPMYQNKNNYRAPLETTSGISAALRIGRKLSGRTTLATFSQNQATWDGIKDPNSGLFSVNGTVAAMLRVASNLLLSTGYRFPIYQKTLSSTGDVFQYGPTFVINISYKLSSGN